jgi:hypothetical protein
MKKLTTQKRPRKLAAHTRSIQAVLSKGRVRSNQEMCGILQENKPRLWHALRERVQIHAIKHNDYLGWANLERLVSKRIAALDREISHALQLHRKGWRQ